MGWHKHVDFVEMQCLECSEVDTWEFWDDVAMARYGGDLGEKLGHNVGKANRCPNCGSTRGEQCD